MEERKSLLDKIKNDTVNIDNVLELTLEILDKYWISYNDSYLKSDYSILAIDFQSAYKTVIGYQIKKIDKFLYFCDLIFSVLPYCLVNSYTDNKTKQILKILKNALTQLGYDVVNDENEKCFKCYRKDLKAEVVASNQPDTTKQKIYKYLTLRVGQIEEKRLTLKSLIDDVEKFCERKSSTNEIGKAKQFFQCVRHTKDDPKKEFPFFYKNEEYWMDYTFQMIIDILSFKDLEERTNKIKDEEKRNYKE